MSGESIPIFRSLSHADVSNLGTLQLYGIFQRKIYGSEFSCSIGATDQYLLYFQNNKSVTPSFICPFNFDLKFEILRETPWPAENIPGRIIGIKFERQTSNQEFQTLEILSQDYEMLQKWRMFLTKRINERNFHSLFRAKKKIGKGAFATVYLAQRLIDKQMVAVKAFSKQRQYSGEQGKQSLINQIKLLRQFNDPHVLKLEGVYQTQNSIYVIMQILEGGQLQDRLKNKSIKKTKQIQQIIKNLLLALQSLAKKNVIHRDLKPQNIMFRKEGQCDLAICDFGLATAAHQEKYLFVRCGTPGFVAPQIINIRDMSTKSQPISDVFSAGLIFHLLLFGRSIFQGRKYQQILAENRACKFDYSKQLYKTIHPAALDLLKRMLEINPRLRITAERALDHPFFSLNVETFFIQAQNEMEIQQSNPLNEQDQNICQMIDENDERGSKYQKLTNVTSNSSKTYNNNSNMFNSSTYDNTTNPKFKTSVHHRKLTKICSNYQKQNDQDYIPFNKKISFGVDQPDLVLRRSKRSSITDKRSKYNHIY